MLRPRRANPRCDRSGERSLAELAAVAWLTALLCCCGKRAAPGGPDASVDPACSSACASLVTEQCAGTNSRARRHADCVQSCTEARRSAETARCGAAHRVYLGCVSVDARGCAPPDVAEGTALEHRLGFAGCEGEHLAYQRCTEPCREEGVVRTAARPLLVAGQEQTVQAELVNAGCRRGKPPLRRAAPSGAPCTHHTVCTQAECACATQGAAYLARACVAGRCADPSVACAVAPRVVRYDACRGP